MAETRYSQIHKILKSRIQRGAYDVGDFLPSEHELCHTYSITRTTARKALDELLKEGFIEKQHGKGSMVKERRQSLGLLTVKGFSEAVGENIQTTFLQKPIITPWPAVAELPFPPEERELKSDCIYFERLRGVSGEPVMRECNYFSAEGLTKLLDGEFVEGSFFKTLSKNFFIEITGSEQELRALKADKQSSELLKVSEGAPILRISVKFSTSKTGLNIYSYLYCNTEKYPIGNDYKH